MARIFVRALKEDEIDQLAIIGLASWRKGVKPLVPLSVAERIERCNPFIPFLHQFGDRILVGEIDGQLAGLGASENNDDTISDVWVAPEFEGLGCGTALIMALEGRAANRGCKQCRISVATANKTSAKSLPAYRLSTGMACRPL